ncbi:MAG TPA: sigma-70 family RNA polymerase sigma factor [Thermoanaerobaculia bacterium]|jgi:RNA polymerase sigma factor (sigma-70 family)|nr:sigma-70 family RNA polymerase sigma factor [Thermoanaerobaculia bacterium]
MHEERVLLEGARHGDAVAFWSLWQQHQRHIYNVCLRHMNGVREDADDASSRAMLLAREKLPAYADSILNVEAWLTRLCGNVCIDMQREWRRARRGAVNIDDLEHSEELAANNASPEADYATAEVMNLVQSAVAQLPEHLREVASMRFFADLPYTTIAERLSISNENVRKRVQQVRCTLRSHLANVLPLHDRRIRAMPAIHNAKEADV